MAQGHAAVTVLEVDPRPLRPQPWVPPQSKSDAQRALVLAGAVNWPELRATVEVDARQPLDIQVIARGLEALEWTVPGPRELDCADGGAPFRFLLSQAALRPGMTRLTGSQRLGERPHRALIDALRATLGVSGLVVKEGTPWPVEVTGAENTTQADPLFRIDAEQSSQFATSLLLACATLHRREGRPWSVETSGPVASQGYLTLTLEWLRRVGFEVATTGRRLTLAGWKQPEVVPTVPGDWSSIAYLLLIAWRSGGTVSRVDVSSSHPDRAMLRLLETVGLSFDAPTGRVLGELRGGLRASSVECPDLIPTLSALACVLPEPSRFEAVEFLKAKESDRLDGIRELVAAAGGATHLRDGVLTLEPPKNVAGVLRAHSRGDHRMAMSAATLACLARVELRLNEPDCVAKSFPGFWDELERGGALLRSSGA